MEGMHPVLNGSLSMFNACHIAIQLIKAKKIKNAMIFTSEVENNAEFFPEKLLGIEETGAAIILDAVHDEKVGFGGVVFKYYTEYIDSAVSSWKQENGKTYAGLTLNGRKPPIFHSLSRIFPTYMKVKRKS